MSSVYQKINRYYNDLSETEQEVIDFILKFKTIEKIKLKDIQDALYISNSTIIRACMKLQYNTFTELKFALIKEKDQEQVSLPIVDDFATLIVTIKKDMLTTLRLVEESQVNKVCDLILKARRLYCVGTGSSSQVAAEFNRKLKLVDLWSNDYLDSFSMKRIPTIINEEDLMIIFSLSGEVSEINEIVVQAKKSKATIVSVTNLGTNSLNKLSDYSLQVYSSPSNRKKVNSRLMLYVAATILFETLIKNIPIIE